MEFTIRPMRTMVNLIYYPMSTAKSQNPAEARSSDVLIGALLRVPAQAIHRRIIHQLNTAGFDDLRLPHIAVLQYPGPDGQRPGTLAERAGMSKQAMNQLLGSLEELGYLTRGEVPREGRSRVVLREVPREGRSRVVRLTRRGRAAYSRIYTILQELEQEWSDELGAAQFAELKRILVRIWDSPLVTWHSR